MCFYAGYFDNVVMPLNVPDKTDAVMSWTASTDLGSQSKSSTQLLNENHLDVMPSYLANDPLCTDIINSSPTDIKPTWLSLAFDDSHLNSLSNGDFLDISHPIVADPKKHKRKRKQDLTLRKHDQIEFIEESSSKHNKFNSRPLKDIKNVMSEERSTDPFICELI